MIGKQPERIERYFVIAVGLFLLSAVGALDYFTGNKISFSIFYLIPIVYVGWYGGKNYGIIFSFAGALLWFAIDSSQNYNGSALDPVFFWNAFVRFGFFLIVASLFGAIRKHEMNLEKNVDARTKDLLNEISEHKKAEEEIIQKTIQLRELTYKIETIKEEENTKIAREIHDELGQSLTAINLEIMWISRKYSDNSDLVERMLMISSIVNDTIKTVRKISSSLRPRLLDQLGILPAIEFQTREFQTRTGIRCNLQLPDDSIMLNSNVSSSLFRIFQEAITNIARHSKASNIQINVSRTADNMLNMSIKDNGIGFDEDILNSNSVKTLGILGMKERAIILGGSLEIMSLPESGTEIILNIPLNQN
jgi:signal transduction histidine kinase